MLTGMYEVMGNDGWFRLSDIESIAAPARAVPEHVETHTLRLDGGRKMEIFEHEAHRLMLRPVQLLPAAPGISMIWGGVECDGDGHGRDVWISAFPVIAWALCFDGQIRVVTPMGVNHGSAARWDDTFVEMASGGIFAVGSDPDEPFFKDRDVFRTYLLLKHDETKGTARG